MALDGFVVNSDYPMDMVVFANEGTLTSFSDGHGEASIAHRLPFTPLPFGVWSTDGGITWQPIVGMSAGSGQLFADIQADGSSVKFIVYQNSAGTNVKYRVFGLAPDGATGDVAPPSLRFSNFTLNTDFNYSKRVASAVWSLTVTSSTPIVTHNLGYIPEAIAWRESSAGVISPLINSSLGNAGEVVLTANNSTINVECPGGAGGSSGIVRIHLRVYGGRNG